MDAEKLAQDRRSDFIRRLFAVTVSVGFASQLNQLLAGSISGRRLLWQALITQHQHQLILLFISLIAVVASWEGYLVSIQRQPLGSVRFYIDVIIVFMYLILMLFSQIDDLWFVVLALIFVLYLIWDAIGAVTNPVDAAHERRPYERSIVITAIWLIVFGVLAIHNYFDVDQGFYLTSAAALCSVVLYRVDKHLRANWLQKLSLLAVPILLLLLALAVRS